MSALYDVVLPHPLGPWGVRTLLFLSFAFHLTFVLLMLGTAIIGFSYFVWVKWGERRAIDRGKPFDKTLLEAFFAYKSLALVFGVGPILIVFMAYSVPFLTGVNVLAPLWLLLIVMLIASLFLIEALAHRGEGHRWVYLGLGIVGMFSLLLVPGVFTGVLANVETPRFWRASLATGHGVPLQVTLYWIARYAHILGAAVVVAAAYLLVKTPRDSVRRPALRRWLAGGLAAQVPLGVALYASVPRSIPFAAVGMLLVAVVAVGLLLWIAASGTAVERMSAAGLMAWVLFVLMPMLIVRQVIQDQVLLPVQARLAERGADMATELRPLRHVAVAEYRAALQQPAQDAETIYYRSCSFCHGGGATGDGPEAADLRVPPADLTQLRAGPAEVRRILESGVEGTAMPPFRYYDDNKLEGLIGLLERNLGLVPGLEPLPQPVSAGDRARAGEVFASLCARCHGPDGTVAQMGRKLRPPPPDFRVLVPAPQHAFDIVTHGIPGTMMRSFESIPEGVRWGLVEQVEGFYQGPRVGLGTAAR